MNIQPTLENENIILQPLQNSDFERLFEVSSDPKVWEQHPNPNRYKRGEFQNFFDGAIVSKGAFLIIDKQSREVAGSSRYYDFNEDENSIFIGYTFYGTKFWGSKLNPQVKKMMLDYIFQYVDLVKLHVGKDNIRSQKAIERLGAEKVKEMEVAYFGEQPKINFEYNITKENWEKQ